MGPASSTVLSRIEFSGPAGPGEPTLARDALHLHLAERLATHLPDHGYKVMGLDNHDSEHGWSVELAHIGPHVAKIVLTDHPLEGLRSIAWLYPPVPSERIWPRRVPTLDLVQALASAVASVLTNGGCRDVHFVQAPPPWP